jgi:MFS family permease
MSTSTSSDSLFHRRLCALYGINFCAGMSMAIFGMLTATWMEESGYQKLLIGVIAATYYLFQIFGAPAAERIMRRAGVRSALVVGLAFASLASPLFAFTRSPVLLGVVRGAAGFGVGVCVTAAQTALISLSSPAKRGFVSGLHALAFALGLALGPLIGPRLYEITPKLAAGFGGLVFAGALLTSLLEVPGGVTGSSLERLPVASKIRAPLHAILAYGFAEATLFSLYPPVLVQRGSTVREIGVVLTMFVLGSIVFTLPVARFGDRYGRERALAGCVALGIVSMLGLLWTDNFVAMVLLAFCAGGGVGASYAVAMALVADPLTPQELPSGMALFTIALGIGCVAGPIITGAALSLFGDSIVFLPAVVIFAVLLPRLSLRSPAPLLSAGGPESAAGHAAPLPETATER